MKSIILTFIVSFLLLTTAAGQGKWEVLSEGTGNTVAFDFINKDTGWMAGDRGIIRTNDGGETWVPIFNGEKSFGDIDFITDSNGWAIEGTLNYYSPPFNILKTLDGGETWFVQKKVDLDHGEGSHRIDLAVITENVVYAVIGDSIFKTNDGGSIWENIAPASGSGFSSAFFCNADTGIVVTGYKGLKTNIYRTFNGGKTWDTLTLPFRSIFNIQFMNGSTFYFLTKYYEKEEKIYKTNDFFSTWSVLYKNDNWIKSFHFYNNDTAIALINFSENTWFEDIKILKTTDGGLNWNCTEHMLLNGMGRYNLYNTPEVTYIFGNNGGGGLCLLLKSVDQGNTWTLKNRMLPFNDVHFTNKETGFLAGGICGYHHSWGALLSTQDGGKTWNFLFNLETNPTEFHFVNEAKAYITTWGMNNGPGATYTSSDGGYSWMKDTTLAQRNNLFFLNDSVGWAIDNLNGNSYKTIDGGQSWEEFFNHYELLGFAVNLNSMFFTDENTGYLVGDGGAIIKFSGEEELKVIESGTTLPLNKVGFIDNEVGWIAGGYRNSDDFGFVVLRTEDGGENWTEIPEVNYLINDFYFENKDHGWAVGEDNKGKGMLIETFDSGLTWEMAIDSLSGRLNALHFADGYGWAVGNNGLILKMIDTTYTSAKAEIANNASTFQLQNYPNPFHSKTVLSYELSESSEVELNVYDLFGCKIATLLKELQPPGKHKQVWNAENMQPGIYICELRTRQGRQAMKMIKIE